MGRKGLEILKEWGKGEEKENERGKKKQNRKNWWIHSALSEVSLDCDDAAMPRRPPLVVLTKA